MVSPKRLVQISIDIFLMLYLAIVAGLSLVWIVGPGNLRDFGSFIASGQLAAAGENPYSYDHPLVFLVNIDSLNLHVLNPNLNPPITVLFFDLLNIKDGELAYRVWQILSLLLYIGCVKVISSTYPEYSNKRKIYWAFCLAGFWHTLELGQIYIILLVFLTGAWIMFHKKKELLAGVFIGFLIAIKPNFVIWLLFLILIKKYKAVMGAIVIAGILTLIPILSYGPGIYFYWRDAVMAYKGYIMPTNYSINGILFSMGIPQITIYISILVLGIGLWVAKRAPTRIESLNGLAVLTSLLLSPITWTGYSILLLPYFFSRPWSKIVYIAAIIFAVPLLIYITYAFSRFSLFDFVFVGRVFGWAMLMLWGEEIVRLQRVNKRVIAVPA